MIRLRPNHPGGFILPGFSWKWVGGPILYWRARRWKVRIRLRFTTRDAAGRLRWDRRFSIERTEAPA